MNSIEFLNEVKESPLCPQNFETIYSEFQSFQCSSLNTLKEVHRVCENNSIPYQVAFGSLLGLIRDGGQIPWDYDIDIFVPFEQKHNLINALNKDLDKKFYFYCPEISDKCRHMIMRITPVEYRSEAIHVDVFFFVGTPENLEERIRYANKIKKLSLDRYWKLVNLKEELLGNKIEITKKFLRYKLPTIFKSLKKINKEYNTLCSMYSSSTSTYCVSADVFATAITLPASLLNETMLLECNYGTVRVPIQYEELLNLIYKDYKTVPPLKSRIEEVISNHKRIKAFCKR